MRNVTALTRHLPPRDIIDKRGNWAMEDWLHWTETFSFLMAPDKLLRRVDPRLARMWELLRAAVCHYFRATSPDSRPYRFNEETCDAAQQNILDYAVMVEKVLML